MGTRQHGYQVNVIDLGLAKKYRDLKVHSCVPYGKDRNLTSTARYTSISPHPSVVQAHRDDLESLAYVLMYFEGRTPRQGLEGAIDTATYLTTTTPRRPHASRPEARRPASSSPRSRLASPLSTRPYVLVYPTSPLMPA
ncbi:serine/threonine protein kinase [Ceratobasidium sp. 370]|nr:serine/threonine protein kinase [Ceratobasidium sp. 370]